MASKVVRAYIGLGFRDVVIEEFVVSSPDQTTAYQLTSHDFRIAVKEPRIQRLTLWINRHV